MTDLAAFVLAAGSGTRLRPLTDLRPKALCPVDNVPLVDRAVANARGLTDDVTVNAWHHRDQMVAHLDGRVRMSVEEEPLGTAGALAAEQDWIDGRPLLVQNADAWHQADLVQFFSDWDGERVRLLVTRDPDRADFDDMRFCGVSLLPWSEVSTFERIPSGLWEVSWKHLYAEGRIDFAVYDGPFFDCGTPASYLAANLTSSGGTSVIGEGALIEGTVERCVIWPGAHVAQEETLSEVIRAAEHITVEARLPAASCW